MALDITNGTCVCGHPAAQHNFDGRHNDPYCTYEYCDCGYFDDEDGEALPGGSVRSPRQL